AFRPMTPGIAPGPPTPISRALGRAHSLFTRPAHSDIYTLSLHDALPILALSVPNRERWLTGPDVLDYPPNHFLRWHAAARNDSRSEEHTSELQSLRHLVCRLLLEKKKHPCCILPCRFMCVSALSGSQI